MNVAIVDVIRVEDLKTIEDKLAHMVVTLFALQQTLDAKHPAHIGSEGLEVLLHELVTQLGSQNVINIDRMFSLAEAIARRIKARLQDASPSIEGFVQQIRDERDKAGQN